MKQLIIAITTIIIIFTIWTCFFIYSMRSLNACENMLKSEILPLVEDEKYDEAERKLNEISDKIDKYISIACFFDDSEALLNIETLLDRSKEFIKADDKSNGSGEIITLYKSIRYINDLQKPSWRNIL